MKNLEDNIGKENILQDFNRYNKNKSKIKEGKLSRNFKIQNPQTSYSLSNIMGNQTPKQFAEIQMQKQKQRQKKQMDRSLTLKSQKSNNERTQNQQFSNIKNSLIKYNNILEDKQQQNNPFNKSSVRKSQSIYVQLSNLYKKDFFERQKSPGRLETYNNDFNKISPYEKRLNPNIFNEINIQTVMAKQIMQTNTILQKEQKKLDEKLYKQSQKNSNITITDEIIQSPIRYSNKEKQMNSPQQNMKLVNSIENQAKNKSNTQKRYQSFDERLKKYEQYYKNNKLVLKEQYQENYSHQPCISKNSNKILAKNSSCGTSFENKNYLNGKKQILFSTCKSKQSEILKNSDYFFSNNNAEIQQNKKKNSQFADYRYLLKDRLAVSFVPNLKFNEYSFTPKISTKSQRLVEKLNQQQKFKKDKKSAEYYYLQNKANQQNAQFKKQNYQYNLTKFQKDFEQSLAKIKNSKDNLSFVDFQELLKDLGYLSSNYVVFQNFYELSQYLQEQDQIIHQKAFLYENDYCLIQKLWELLKNSNDQFQSTNLYNFLIAVQAGKFKMLKQQSESNKGNEKKYFDRNEETKLIYINDDQKDSIAQDFQILKINKLAQKKRLIDDDMEDFQPSINNQSEKLAEYFHEKIANEILHQNENEKISLKQHADLLIYQKQRQCDKLKASIQRINEKQMKECTFKPAINNPSSDEQRTINQHINHSFQLYELYKNKLLRVNKQTDEQKDQEYEKQAGECTFSPDIYLSSKSYNNFIAHGKNQTTNNGIVTGFSKEIERIQNARILKSAERLQRQKGNTSNKKIFNQATQFAIEQESRFLCNSNYSSNKNSSMNLDQELLNLKFDEDKEKIPSMIIDVKVDANQIKRLIINADDNIDDIIDNFAKDNSKIYKILNQYKNYRVIRRSHQKVENST